MPTKRELTLGGAGLGSLAGLAYGLRTSAGFWSTWGYSIIGGFMGNMGDTAVGHLTGAADPANPETGTELQLRNATLIPATLEARRANIRTLARPGVVAERPVPEAALGEVPTVNW